MMKPNEIILEEIKAMEAIDECPEDCDNEEEEKNQEESYLSLGLEDDDEEDEE